MGYRTSCSKCCGKPKQMRCVVCGYFFNGFRDVCDDCRGVSIVDLASIIKKARLVRHRFLVVETADQQDPFCLQPEFQHRSDSQSESDTQPEPQRRPDSQPELHRALESA